MFAYGENSIPQGNPHFLFDNGLKGIVVNRESNYVYSFFKGSVSVTMAMPDLSD